MESWFPIIMLWLVVFWLLWSQKKTRVAGAIHHKHKTREEKCRMEEMAKEFVGKDCLIYTITSNGGEIQGKIVSVRDCGILLEDKTGQKQAINLEYVTRIREYPTNKKGKKKSIITD